MARKRGPMRYFYDPTGKQHFLTGHAAEKRVQYVLIVYRDGEWRRFGGHVNLSYARIAKIQHDERYVGEPSHITPLYTGDPTPQAIEEAIDNA